MQTTSKPLTENPQAVPTRNITHMPPKHKQTNEREHSKAMQLSLNDNIVQDNAYGKLRKRSYE